jgi:hypothetical protein
MTIHDFRHIRLDEQAAPGSLTTPVIADGAVTPPKIGLLASVVIQDITYTAVTGGISGNSITVTYVEDAVAGSETVDVVGTDITVHIGNPTLTISSIVDLTHFQVVSSAHVQAGDTITQGLNSTTVVSVPDAAHIEVVDTTGFTTGSALDNGLLSTANQVFSALVLSFAVSRLVTFVITGTGSNKQVGVGVTNLSGGQNAAFVKSLHADASPILIGDIQLVSGTNIVLSQVGNTITISSNTVPDFVAGEDLTGQITGSNFTFTLANTPVTDKEMVYLNGVRLRRGVGNDYTISGATITMVAAPQLGDSLVADYIKI